MQCKPGKLFAQVSALLLAQALFTLPAMAAAGDNVRFHGALVAEPCVIPPGEEEIALDFGTIVDKYLYLNTRTPGQPFTLHLTDCDQSLGQTVKVSFLGTESPALPGLLAIDGSGGASGIAIGLETQQAVPLPLNKASGTYPLRSGDNLIGLKAFVQGEPAAIANQAIGLGAFSAVATFSLEYE